MKKEKLKDVIKVLSSLEEDVTVPKNVRESVKKVISVLKGGGKEMSLKVNKALHILEEVSSDMNMEPYTRTQLMNVVSLLEKL